jgi:hypothetical protein
MRLTELKEKVRSVRVPHAIYYELIATEVDTVGPDSPEAKVVMADELRRAEPGGAVMKVPFSPASMQYLLRQALPNLIDIATDNQDRALVGKLQKFQARLNAALETEAAAMESLIRENPEHGSYKTVVIYPGRFQPPHIGHMKAWQWLNQKFGNAYIATSDKVEPPRSPFNFNEKQRLLQFAGVPVDHIVQVKNPYQAAEIVSKFDAESTVLIFAISQKDMEEDPRFKFAPKKDGSPGYLQPYDKNQGDLRPLNQVGYVTTVPTFNFNVMGSPMRSATEFRANFAQANDSQQAQMIKDLYGKYDAGIHKLLKDRIA